MLLLPYTPISNVPVGYPSPDNAKAVQSFIVSADWGFEDWLAHESSIEKVFELVRENVRKDVPQYDENTVDEIAGKIFNDLLHNSIDRHEAPFFSPGIKKFLGAWGEAVTKSDELRSSFVKHFAPEVTRLLRTRSIKQLARDIAKCAELDDPYRGNFSGYPASLISRILRELVAKGQFVSKKA